ncbi:hypothetical protein BJ138DRAFT_1122388 [Hygrophoropsis aurantiaca]|uniref:Uncharacterized protein n=1 Tax=Hygrophoropsis aurantiaca TaxID=72124 RepID=A0ACB8AQ50_9AGAM|nr:hypothetical protein BJ138DRAFT_1122388 [Hygrophoropsis aurantiaca]
MLVYLANENENLIDMILARDDDDAFLYGEALEMEPPKTMLATSVPQQISYEAVAVSNGVIESLETKAEEEDPPFGPGPGSAEPETVAGFEENGFGEGEDEESEDEDEDDIEIIMDQPSRSLDLRKNVPARSTSATHSTPNRPPPSSLTTEYTPRDRNALTRPPAPAPAPTILPTTSAAVVEQSFTDSTMVDEGPDPSSLPPAVAPPSHPSINPSIPGVLDGRSILEMDMTAMAEKPWRRPGSDISDWFNYGFDEISWEAYCYRRRDLGELANVLKTNVINFAGMPEDQLTALPPELRTMVMTGANAMMANGGPNPNMMGAGVGMNPMMDMSGMAGMNMGPMGMPMNGDMGMQMQPGGAIMQDGSGAVPVGTNGTPEQGVQMGMQDGYGVGGPGPAMIGMGMGNDFGMQEQGSMGQPMYTSMEGSVTPHAPAPGPSGPPPGPSGPTRGASPAQFRGRGMQPGLRGRGGFGGRGRGRYGSESGPPPPVRPASPLPPGVPTGPRNQNRYKDRDGNAPAVDGLDYGGTVKDAGGRTPSGEPEERSLSRKRRMSPGVDDARGSKRR